MRLDYVKSASVGITAGKLRAVEVEMEYLPDCSKNAYKLRNGAVKKQVREWMDCLSFMVRSLVNGTGLEMKTPVKVRIDGIFKDKRSTPDIHNLLIVTCDSIQEALGINDQEYKTETGYPELGLDPMLIITIESGE